METINLNLEPLPHDVFNYTKIIVHEIFKESDKAIHARFSTKEQSGIVSWLPKSQCRIDNNGEVWISKWLEDKI